MTHSECVSVALIIQKTMHMCRIVLSSVVCLAVQYYFTLGLSHEQQDLRKKDTEHKTDFDFLYN
jgi:hypothetical protein